MPRVIGRALLASVLVACSGATPDPVRRVNEPLPEISGQTLDGREISASDFLGKILVINVWASWCDPCETEEPELVRVANAYADRGVAFLGINHTDQLVAAKVFAERFDVPYPSIWDPEGRFSAVLGYFGLPDTYVVDAQGTIRFEISATATNERQLSGLLDELLAEGSP